jgi:cytochrome c-type biogenesis protein
LESAEINKPTENQGLNHRFATFSHALLFVLGFSAVFVIGWGGAATAAGQLFGIYKPILGKIGGVVAILFGLFTFKIIRIPWLNYDTRPQWFPKQGGGTVSSFLMGIFFAAGWTPCIGTTLGAILTLGMSQQSAAQAMVLTSGYALGLGIPFLMIGLGMDRVGRWIVRFRRYLRVVEIISGILLISVGILILTDSMTQISIWALRNGYYLDLPLGGAAVPTYLVAFLAGLISFLSPCVLPLVPAYVGYLSGRVVEEH